MWDTLTSLNNLFTAYHQVARGKRNKPDGAGVEMNLEDNLISLREKLVGQTYRHGPYHSFYIHIPKKRLISAACFEDRVVHQALCRVIEPPIEKSFIDDSYANRIVKGRIRHWTVVCNTCGVMNTICRWTSANISLPLTTLF